MSQRGRQTRTVCRYFASTASCRFGDTCRFSHDPLSFNAIIGMTSPLAMQDRCEHCGRQCKNRFICELCRRYGCKQHYAICNACGRLVCSSESDRGGKCSSSCAHCQLTCCRACGIAAADGWRVHKHCIDEYAPEQRSGNVMTLHRQWASPATMPGVDAEQGVPNLRNFDNDFPTLNNM